MTPASAPAMQPSSPDVRPQAEPGSVTRRNNEGHGRRLTAAFEALEAFPALAESRNRVLLLLDDEKGSTGDLVGAVESDIALTIAVLRLANQVQGPTRGRTESIVKAVDVLSPESVHAVLERVRTFDFFERGGVWDVAPEQFRLHALATQRAAESLATELSYPHRDRLMITALLHDIGKLVLLHAYTGYPAQILAGARTPEERVHRERRELGVDHALVGGVLARRWGLPKAVATTIERHHSDDADQEAVLVRLADMLAHYAHGGGVTPAKLLEVGRSVGMGPELLRRVLFELPFAQRARNRAIDPCPLSERELEVLKRLATGRVYKQIAAELSLSTSTVRTHLHNIYGKLGAVDRAQAVLVATERGWI